MKINLLLAVAGAAMLLSGCATSNLGLVLDSVGPAPTTVASNNGTTGTLLVYSAYEVNPDFNSRDTHRREFSDYRILNADGQLRQWVHNNSGTMLQRPQQVELPPGAYRVESQANGYGLVTVPVTLEAGQETIVHLEGGVRWSGQFDNHQANAVRLPDGEIVGWKSATAMK